MEIYALTNAHGMEARIMTYGASIVSLKAPDRRGHLENIVLGFDELEPYLAGVPYYGATVGRYANRIAGARFALDGTTYPLSANDGTNSLHGGSRGFDKRIWRVDTIGSETNRLRFTYVSRDGEEGFPGEFRSALRPAVVLSDPGSGRVLEIRTTQPGLQFYSGNFMNGKPAGEGSVFGYRTGLCLETQHFPDSPNHAAFPNTILRPGDTYSERTVLHFRTTDEAAK